MWNFVEYIKNLIDCFPGILKHSKRVNKFPLFKFILTFIKFVCHLCYPIVNLSLTNKLKM